MCFGGIHELLVACKNDFATSASLAPKSTVYTCKFTELNLCFHASCCFLRYTVAVLTE